MIKIKACYVFFCFVHWKIEYQDSIRCGRDAKNGRNLTLKSSNKKILKSKYRYFQVFLMIQLESL
jgi:hypothetical protein